MTLPRRAGVLVLLAALLTAAAGGAAASAAASPGGASAGMKPPLAGSITSGSDTWATVVMGKGDGAADRFWQLFTLGAKPDRFSLATPPGVADNGGLIVAPGGTTGAALVGFGASQDLRFSPLAATADAGREWSPGGLPTGILPTPSALAASPSRSLALAGAPSARVLERSGSLTDWRVLVTAKTLASTAAGRTCDVTGLDAVALEPTGAALVGVTCAKPAGPGVLVDSDGRWLPADIPVPAALRRDSFATVRLGASFALLAGEHGGSVALVAAWARAAGRPWETSAPLPIATPSDLVATGAGPGATQFVVLRTAHGLRAELVAGPGSPWTALPALPQGTATLALAPDGTRYALTVKVAELGVWRLEQGRWTATQHIQVPIPFGTSS